MTLSLISWVLSKAAKNDIEAIFDYSETTFGLDQAVRYTEGFNACF